MAFGFVVALLAVAAAAAWWWRTRDQGPAWPGPPCSLLSGAKAEFEAFFRAHPEHAGNVMPLFEQWVARYGPVLRWTTWGRRNVMVSSPELVKHVLHTAFEQGAYDKGPGTRAQFRVLLGDGIFNSAGALWKAQRRTATRMFHVSRIKDYVPVIQRHAATLRELVGDGRGEDVQARLLSFTADTFAEIAFGVDLGVQRSPRSDFFAALDFVQAACQRRGRHGALWRWLESDKAKLRREVRVINDFVADVVRQKREQPEQGDDLLSRMLADGAPEAEVRDFVVNFLIAGRDTTALMLTWTLFLLAQHPEAAAAVIAEADAAPETLALADVRAMRFTKSCLLEALRLYPPVPIEALSALKDDVLPTGHLVRKGTVVYYSAWVMHRLPELFPEPQRFKPDRFLAEAPKPYLYTAFHGGSRRCLGQELALAEGAAALAVLLRGRSGIALADGFQPQLRKTVVLMSGNGMRVELS